MLWILLIALVAVAGLVLAVASARRRETERAERARVLDGVREAMEEIDPNVLLGGEARGLIAALQPPETVEDPEGAQESAVLLPWSDIPHEVAPRSFAGSLAFQLRERARAHDRPLQLNVDAPTLGLRLVRSDRLTAFPGGPPPSIGIGETGLRVLFAFRPSLESTRLIYLSRASLDETGLDDDGLFGALLAMLRQELDEAPIETLLRAGGRCVIDGHGPSSAACLLLVPELLGPEDELFALVPASDRLLLTDPPGLVTALRDEASSRERETWLSPHPLTVRPDGIRLAESAKVDC